MKKDRDMYSLIWNWKVGCTILFGGSASTCVGCKAYVLQESRGQIEVVMLGVTKVTLAVMSYNSLIYLQLLFAFLKAYLSRYIPFIQ